MLQNDINVEELKLSFKIVTVIFDFISIVGLVESEASLGKKRKNVPHLDTYASNNLSYQWIRD